jgi:hypothetical protein
VTRITEVPRCDSKPCSHASSHALLLSHRSLLNRPPQVTSLGAMQVAKRLPMEDSDFIQKLRVGYVAAQVISLAIYFYIQMQVSRESLTCISGRSHSLIFSGLVLIECLLSAGPYRRSRRRTT